MNQTENTVECTFISPRRCTDNPTNGRSPILRVIV